MDSDRVVIVTGASRGIGREIALRLASDGHDVVVGYRFALNRAEGVVAEIEAIGRRAIASSVDVVDEGTVAALFERAAELGPVTGLVNSAGLIGPTGELADMQLESVRRMLDVNLLGSLTTSKHAIRAMREEGGAIVNTSSAVSSAGMLGRHGFNAAAAAAIEDLTVALAAEVAGYGIRVNAVAPDATWSADDTIADRGSQIAGAVAWLLSDEAAATTGTVIRIAARSR